MKTYKYRSKLRQILNQRLLIALLILSQIVLLLFMLLRSYQFYWLSISLTLLSILTSLHLLTHHEKSAFKLSLIFLLGFFPVAGGVLYWIFHFQTGSVGFRRRMQRINRELQDYQLFSAADLEEAQTRHPGAQKLLRYLQDTVAFPVYHHTETEYFPYGKGMLERLLSDLRSAERFIFLEYFIIDEGIMWDSILEVLRERIAHGVDVRVIYDDLGCILTLPADYPKKLRAQGIPCAVFNPFHPFLTGSQNNRDHRKIAVIDGRVAYTGGINLADEYINEKIRFGHWKDNAVRLEGEAARGFTLMFLQMWDLLTKTKSDYPSLLPPPEEVAAPNDGWVQPYTDCPMDKENVGEHVYRHVIERTQRYLYITTPYLMVDDDMISSLKLSAKSGVDVRIIAPGMPDKRLVHFTTRSYYRELIDAGIKIYEYSEGFIHAKTFLSDGDLAIVGTVNMDFRSLYLHFECGACLYGTACLPQIEADYLDTLSRCRQITAKDCKTGFLVKLFQDICRLLAPLM